MTATADAARQRFREVFDVEPAGVAVAPGRVNLIGEHVDYVGGLVLPAAVDRRLAIAVGPAGAWRVDSQVEGGEKYVRALAAELGAGPLSVAIVSDVPVGGGLSSSAALLVAAAAALAPDLDGVEAARLCRRAEQAAAGVRVGIMDQFASALGREGFALLLNCATLDHHLIPFPPDLVIGLLSSGVGRDLAETPYNQRRAEAEAALSGAGALVGERRLRHIVSEIGRVGEFVAALAAGDHATLGRLLDASHASLRDDFEVSTPEVEAAVARARAVPGCLGARVMGAGFGGTVLALLEAGSEAGFTGAGGFVCRTATGPFARS